MAVTERKMFPVFRVENVDLIPGIGLITQPLRVAFGTYEYLRDAFSSGTNCYEMPSLFSRAGAKFLAYLGIQAATFTVVMTTVETAQYLSK